MNVFDGKEEGGGKDTIVSASVRVNEVTTIAAAAERPRPPTIAISEELERSRRLSSADITASEGVMEPAAVQFLVESAAAVACRVSIVFFVLPRPRTERGRGRKFVNLCQT